MEGHGDIRPWVFQKAAIDHFLGAVSGLLTWLEHQLYRTFEISFIFL